MEEADVSHFRRLYPHVVLKMSGPRRPYQDKLQISKSDLDENGILSIDLKVAAPWVQDLFARLFQAPQGLYDLSESQLEVRSSIFSYRIFPCSRFTRFRNTVMRDLLTYTN